MTSRCGRASLGSPVPPGYFLLVLMFLNCSDTLEDGVLFLGFGGWVWRAGFTESQSFNARMTFRKSRYQRDFQAFCDNNYCLKI